MAEKFKHKIDIHSEGNQKALEQQAHERREELREQAEKSAEVSSGRASERAPKQMEQEAKELASTAEKQQVQLEKHVTPAEKRREKLIRNKKTLDASFNREMKEVRSSMPAVSQAFSKVIHNKSVERVSEAAGKTVARPNAILAGSTFALIFTALLYLWAKNAGYPLSGFETIASFIIGWLCGIIFDYVRIAATGKS